MRIESLGPPGAGKSSCLQMLNFPQCRWSTRDRIARILWSGSHSGKPTIPSKLRHEELLRSGYEGAIAHLPNHEFVREFSSSFNRLLFNYSRSTTQQANCLWDDGFVQRSASLVCIPGRHYSLDLINLIDSQLRPDCLLYFRVDPDTAICRILQRNHVPSKMKRFPTESYLDYVRTFLALSEIIVDRMANNGVRILELDGNEPQAVLAFKARGFLSGLGINEHNSVLRVMR